MKILKSIALTSLFAIPLLIKLPWIINSWIVSPLDRLNPIYAVIGIGLALWFWEPSQKLPRIGKLWGMALAGVGLLGFIAGFLFHINSAAAAASILVLAGGIGAIYGWLIFLVFSPVYLSFGLAIPTTSYQLSLLASNWLPGLNLLTIHAFKGVVALAVVGAAIIVAHLTCRKQASPISITGAIVGVLIASAGWFMLNQQHTTDLFGPTFHVDTTIGKTAHWQGMVMTLTPADEEFFGKIGATKSIFINQQNMGVTTVKVPAKDLHKIHPPEYCLTGGGWNVVSRALVNIELSGKTMPMSVIKIQKDNASAFLFYWYSSDTRSTPSFVTFRKIVSDKEPWVAYQFAISGITSQDQAQTAFLELLQELGGH